MLNANKQSLITLPGYTEYWVNTDMSRIILILKTAVVYCFAS